MGDVRLRLECIAPGWQEPETPGLFQAEHRGQADTATHRGTPDAAGLRTQPRAKVSALPCGPLHFTLHLENCHQAARGASLRTEPGLYHP